MPPRRTAAPSLVLVNGPEGASFAYMKEYMDGDRAPAHALCRDAARPPGCWCAPRAASAAPRSTTPASSSWSSTTSAKRRSGLGHHGRDPRQARRPAGCQGLPRHAPGLRLATQKPVQFVIGGGTYEELAQWRDILLAEIEQVQSRAHRHRLGLQGDQAATARRDRLRARGRPRGHGRRHRPHPGDHARLAQGHHLSSTPARNTTSSWRASATPSAPRRAWRTSMCARRAAAR